MRSFRVVVRFSRASDRIHLRGFNASEGGTYRSTVPVYCDRLPVDMVMA